MHRFTLTLLLAFTHANSLWAQYCNDTRFTALETFDISDVEWEYNIPYGLADEWFMDMPQPELNYFDIAYPDPSVDPLEKRPLILLAHGGGFWAGEKEAMAYHMQLLAQAGYVVVSPNYRKGWFGTPTDCDGDPESLVIAIYRAMQDVQACLRYLTANADTYGIDTAHIYAGGESAGVYAVLTSMFTSQVEWDAEFPAFSAMYGTITGETNNLNVDFSIKGYICMWGGIYDVYDIASADAKPTIAFYGISDDVIPPFFGNIQYCPDFPYVYGGAGITNFLTTQGICNELHVNPMEGHLAYEPEYTAPNIACFVKSVMCETCATGTYDFREADCDTLYIEDPVPVADAHVISAKVFPNPSAEYVHVLTPADWSGQPEVMLTNASGALVTMPYKYSENMVILDVHDLPSGIYYIQLHANLAKASATFVVVE